MNKKLVNFGPLTPEIMRLMFTYPKLTLRVLRMIINALEFNPHDFSTGRISALWISLPIGLTALGGLASYFASNF